MINEGIQKNAMNFLKYGVFLFGILVALDQITKDLIAKPFLNNNFAFSLPIPIPLIYIIYFFVITAIGYYIFHHYKSFSLLSFLAWVFILSGAFSNIAERIVQGAVRDWIYIYNGIFNLADFYIILGIIILLLQPNKK